MKQSNVPNSQSGALGIQQAYKNWSSLRPEASCCSESHFMVTRHPETRLAMLEAKPDDQVCERERNWRAYIAVRDNKTM